MCAKTEASGDSVTIRLFISVVWKCQFGASLVTRFDWAFDHFGDLYVSTSRSITNAAIDGEFLGHTSKEFLLQ